MGTTDGETSAFVLPILGSCNYVLSGSGQRTLSLIVPLRILLFGLLPFVLRRAQISSSSHFGGSCLILIHCNTLLHTPCESRHSKNRWLIDSALLQNIYLSSMAVPTLLSLSLVYNLPKQSIHTRN